MFSRGIERDHNGMKWVNVHSYIGKLPRFRLNDQKSLKILIDYLLIICMHKLGNIIMALQYY